MIRTKFSIATFRFLGACIGRLGHQFGVAKGTVTSRAFNLTARQLSCSFKRSLPAALLLGCIASYNMAAAQENPVTTDVPVISFKETRVSGAITDTAVEGRYLTFFFESDRTHSENITLNIEISETGNYIGESPANRPYFIESGTPGTYTAVLSSGTHLAKIRVATQDDSMNEHDGTISATVTPGEGYSVNESNDTGSFTMEDNDTPVVRISPRFHNYIPYSPAVASFYLILNKAFDREIPVRIQIEQTGNVLEGTAGTRQIVISPRSTYFPFSIPTKVSESDASVTVTILKDNSGAATYKIDKTRFSHRMEIYTAPRISVVESRVNGNHEDSAIEGESITFVFSASRALDVDYDFDVRLSQTGFFAISINSSPRITMRARSTTAYLTVRTVDDRVYERNGEITATVLTPFRFNPRPDGYIYRYLPDSSQGSLSIRIVDNDETKVSIGLGGKDWQTYFEPGETLPLKFTITPEPTVEIPVRLEINQTADIAKGLDPRVYRSGTNTELIVNVPAGVSEYYYPIETNDNIGSIHIFLHENDNSIRPYKAIGEPIIAANMTPTPEFSFEKVTMGNRTVDSATEGNKIIFFFSANSSHPGGLPINYRIRQKGNFILDGVEKARLGKNTNYSSTDNDLQVVVETEDDEIDELDGRIYVKIFPGDYYTINRSKREGSIAILDNDTTVVSVQAVADQVKPYSNAEFTLTANPAPVENMPVSIRVEQTLNVVANSDLGTKTLIIPTGISTITYSVPTIDDGGVGIGAVKISLEENSGGIRTYSIDTADFEAQVGVDRRPVISFKEVRIQEMLGNRGTEGSLFSIAFETEQIRTVNFSINVEISESVPYVKETLTNQSASFQTAMIGFNTIELAAGDSLTSIRVATHDDRTDEISGTITATLLPGDDYIIDNTKSTGEITVDDNDNTIVSIEADDIPVRAGSQVEFRLIMDPQTAEAVPVNVDIQQSGSFLAGSAGTMRYVVPADVSEWTFAVPTSSRVDTVTEGDVTARLLEHTTGPNIYSLTSATEDQSATVKVWNEPVLPVISFKEVRIGGELSDVGPEGSLFVFVFEADRAPLENINVNFDVREQGTFVVGTSTMQPSFKAVGTTGMYSANMSDDTLLLQLGVATENDTADENDGTITVELKEGAGYYVNPRNINTKTVSVKDDDETIVSIVRSPETVEAGTDAVFRLVITPATEVAFPVNVNLHGHEGFLIGGARDIIIDVPAGVTELDFNVATVDTDREGGENSAFPTFIGLITATVLDPTGTSYIYRKNPNLSERSFSVKVVAKDSLPTISFKETKIGHRLTNNGNEGSTFTFVFGIDKIYSHLSIIDFSVVETGSFISDSTKLYAYTEDGYGRNPNVLRRGKSVEIKINTEEDDIDEPDGTITVKILPGANYKVSTSSHSGQVTVRDNDEALAHTVGIQSDRSSELELSNSARNSSGNPVLSIGSRSASISEGEVASFVIIASTPLTSAITVLFKVESDNGRFTEEDKLGSLQFDTGRSLLNLNIPTIEDDIEEPSGKITISIIQGVGYELDISAMHAEIEVKDNDADQSYDALVEKLIHDVQPVLLRTMGSQSQNAIEFRLQNASVEPNKTSLSLTGRQSWEDMLVHGGKMLNQNDRQWSSLLRDTKFAIELFPEDGSANASTFWGWGEIQDVTSNPGSSVLSWNGNLYSGHTGLDVRISNELIAGISASITKSQIDFSDAVQDSEISGRHNTDITLLQPYVGWFAPESSSAIYAGTGFGQGSIEIEGNERGVEVLKSNILLAHLNGNGLLHAFENNSKENSSELRFKGTAWGARQLLKSNQYDIEESYFDAQHLRLDFIGNHYFETSYSTFNPSASVGVIWNGGDGNLTSGILSNGTLNYQNWSGLKSSASTTLLVNELTSESAYNVSAQMEVDLGGNSTTFELGYSSISDFPQVENTSLPSRHVVTDYNQFNGLLGSGRLNSGVRIERKINDSAGKIILENKMIFADNGYREYSMNSKFFMNKHYEIAAEISRKLETGGNKDYRFGFANSIQW